MNASWKTILKGIAGCVLAVVLVKAFLVTSCFIPSSGMENSLYEGEGVLVNKWSYGLRMPFPSVFGYHRIGSCDIRKGDIVLFNDPSPGNPSRWMEGRSVFISRCIGRAGDTLLLNRELIDAENEVWSPDNKALYVYPSAQEDTVQAILKAVGISENPLVGYTEEGDFIRSFSRYELYLVAQKGKGKVIFTPLNAKLAKEVHPYVVPEKGIPVMVYPWNAVLLCNTIVSHEGKNATVQGDTLWVEGTLVHIQ